MNTETLLRVKQADPWPEDRPTPEGVWHASQALDEIVQRTTQRPGKPTGPIGSGPVVAVVAAVIVLVLVGGFALLINNSGETQPAVTVVTTLVEITPSTVAESAPPTTIASTNPTLAAEPVPPPGEGPQLEFVPVEVPGGSLSNAVWFQGAMVAMSGEGLFRSSDGFTWELLPASADNLEPSLQGLETGGGLLVSRGEEFNGSGCGLPGDAMLVHTSNNGVDWKTSRVEIPIPDPPTLDGCFGDTGREGFAVGPAGIMIFGGVTDDHHPEDFPGTGYAFFSPDGQTWTQLDASGPLDGGEIVDVVATADGFVATSTRRSPFLWETTDGTTWIQKSTDPWLSGRSGLGVWDGRLVSATMSGVWTIEDTPQELITSDGMSDLFVIGIGEFGLVGMRTESNADVPEVLFSENGTTWNRWTPPEFGLPGFGVVYLVGIGDDFVVLRTLTVDTAGSATGESYWVGRLP